MKLKLYRISNYILSFLIAQLDLFLVVQSKSGEASNSLFHMICVRMGSTNGLRPEYGIQFYHKPGKNIGLKGPEKGKARKEMWC